MKALPKRKGNYGSGAIGPDVEPASMKALPKRKGNPEHDARYRPVGGGLNESPSEKEGKYSV